MKTYRFLRTSLLLFLLTPLLLAAQDQRLTKTKVADALALLPTADNAQADRVFHDLLNTGSEGLTLITDQVQPNGNESGVASRYAVSLLTHYAKTKEEKASIEQAFLAALSRAQDAEVKAYFLDNLQLIGSDASVKAISGYIGEATVYDKAISALTRIGTPSARKALQDALGQSSGAVQARLIKALGDLKHLPALESITKLAASGNADVKKQALWAIALIGDAGSYDILLREATAAGFKNDPTEASIALIEFLHQSDAKGNVSLVSKISQAILAGTPVATQQHFRLAGLESFVKSNPSEALKTLVKERTLFDAGYRKEVLKIAAPGAGDPAAVKVWKKEYKKATGVEQAELLSLLAGANRTDVFVETDLLPALASPNADVRTTAAAEVALSRNQRFAGALADYLLKCTDENELRAAKAALLQLVGKDNTGLIAQKIEKAPSKNGVALLQVLAERRAVSQFEVVAKYTASSDASISAAALEALPNVSASGNINYLLKMLGATEGEKELKAIQGAIIAALDKTSIAKINEAYATWKIKLLPVLAYVGDEDALGKVVTTFKSGTEKESAVAFEALTNWQNNGAVRTLLTISKDESLKKNHAKAFAAGVSQTVKSSWPDDQKLLILRELMSAASGAPEKVAVIRAAGTLRSFLSLIFVSGYADDPELSSAASRSAMQIALPTSDAKPGLTGVEVRNILSRILNKLTGEDSQYERIDIATYLEKLPYTRGYESIFNGKDLSGWQGLVENPIARAKMTKEVLAKKQQEANEKVKANWSVKDGAIVFQGDGANLCTTRPYGDCEMIVDWKISRNGDSGIYLRGSPQVQIWDIARTDVGAQVGSGGLYNNQKEPSKPLVVADNPVGEWNTFYIKMVGERVTVYLNGILVVDNVKLENYWDRTLPIFAEEAIELQAHGTELAFRNIYVKELSSKPYELTKEEKDAGFEVLFNGKNLDNWVGNKTDYVVEDNTIAIYPTKEGHGNLYTEKEFSDFVYRFEFQLTPGANNGLGIHAPLEGDAAYVGKEIQILDNTAAIYSTLQPYQYHGSVYGVLPAKREFLRPVGEWNQEEVYVKGDSIRVTLNGTVIVDGDLKKATKTGTMDHKDHPGLNRHNGHIGFLGHGSVVKFRSIRIKGLAK